MSDRAEVMACIVMGGGIEVEHEDDESSQILTPDDAREYAENLSDEKIADAHPSYEGKYTASSVIRKYADMQDDSVPPEEQTDLVPIEN